GQGIDAVGEQSDLHVGRASVASVEPVLLDNSGSIGLNNGHNYVYSFSSTSVTVRSIRFCFCPGPEPPRRRRPDPSVCLVRPRRSVCPWFGWPAARRETCPLANGPINLCFASSFVSLAL